MSHRCQIKFNLLYNLRCIFFCLIVMIFPLTIGGQQLNYSVHNVIKQGHVEIPFQYINGVMVVEVFFEHLYPLNFIFDTGAENTVLLKNDLITALNIPVHKKIRLLGSDLSREIYAFVCNGVYLQVANMRAERHNVIVLEESYLLPEEYLGTRIDGILGGDFFAGRIVQINYRRQIITLIDKRHFSPKKVKGYDRRELEVKNKKPYMTCQTAFTSDIMKETKLLIDTGAGLSAIFYQFPDTSLMHGRYVKGNLGQGLGGDIEGFMGRIHTMSFGDFTFKNMISSFQPRDSLYHHEDVEKRHGLIGNLILERFDVVIHYPDRALYLKAKKHYNKAFEFDKSGMTIFSYGKNLKDFYVRHVMAHSPAAEADIRVNDIILSVNGWPAKWMSLNKINQKLSGKTGKKVKFKLRRGTEVIKREVVLRALF